MNFLPVQIQARLGNNTICFASLCPSMDLIAVGLSGDYPQQGPNEMHQDVGLHSKLELPKTASSVVIYRTISWQKLMTLGNAELKTELLDASAKHNDDSMNSTDHQDSSERLASMSYSSIKIGITCLHWSSDGRQLVLGTTTSHVLIYNVETTATTTTTTTTTTNTNNASLSDMNHAHDTSLSSLVHSFRVPSTQEQPSQPNNVQEDSNHFDSEEDEEVDDDDDSTNDTTNTSIKQVLTRSMTLAQQKRIMRMQGKTPNAKVNVKTDKTMMHTPRRLNTYKTHSTRLAPSNSSSSSSLATIPVRFQWQRIIHSSSNSNSSYDNYSFLDRQQLFLPQCQYQTQTNSWMKAMDPLTVLVILTVDGSLHYYAHGRYRLVSIPPLPTEQDSGYMSNTSFILDCALQTSIFTGRSLTIQQIPTLLSQRYHIQYISYFYIHITNHIQTITQGMKDASNTWSTATRQLDLKWDQLYSLFVKYGVIPSSHPTFSSVMGEKNITAVRMELLNYILGGHSSRLADSCNAMDQFFTHPLMNDQLLLRMFKTCETNVINVEQIVKRNILGPIRSLLYDVGELNGVVHAMTASAVPGADPSSTTTSTILMQADTSERMVEATKILYIVAEQCLSQLVEIRLRLDCLMKWIRATASLVKAKGTAADSVQKQNARNRLVSEQVLRKVADFLSTPLKTLDSTEPAPPYGSTECIMGILWTDYFQKNIVYVEKPQQQQLSSTTARNSYQNEKYNFVEIPSLREVLKVTSNISKELFEDPRTVLNNLVKTTKVSVQNCIGNDGVVSAIHTRYRLYGSNTSNENDIFASNTHWTILVNTCSNLSDNGYQQIQITAVPVGESFETAGDNEDHDDVMLYQSTIVSLPKNCVVTCMQFYSDDGISTLTPVISSRYSEGRQALGIVLKRREGFMNETLDEELWILKYDELEFTQKSARNGDSSRDFRITTDVHHSGILVPEGAINESENDIDEYKKRLCIPCRWRKIKSNVATGLKHSSQLILSGSRGIGGIYTQDGNTIDLYDMEDDEENEKEEEDDDSDES